MKNYWKTILYILIIILLFFSASFLYLKTHEKEIKEKVLSEINTYFITKINAEDIRLSFLKKFPNISIVLKNVTVNELPAGSEEKVALAKSIFMTINILNFLHKNYIVEHIEIDRLALNLKIYKNGSDNFSVLKEEKSTQPHKNEAFSFNLKKIRIVSSSLSFLDFRSHVNYRSTISRMDFTGKFTEKNSVISLKAKTTILHFSVNQHVYLASQKLDIVSDFILNQNNGSIYFSNSSFHLDKAGFIFSGSVRNLNGPGPLFVDMQSSSNEFSLKDMVSFIPERLKKKYSNYDYNGMISFHAAMKGSPGPNSNPYIRVDLNLNDGTLKSSKNSLDLHHIQFKGNYCSISNGKNMPVLDIQNFSAVLFDKKIEGSFYLENPDDPYIRMKINADVDLKQLNELIMLKGIREITGNAVLSGMVNGKLSDIKSGKDGSEADLKLTISQVNIRPDSSYYGYENLNGEFYLLGNDLAINNFSGIFAGSDFELNGIAVHAVRYILSKDKDRKLIVRAKMTSRLFDMNKLINPETGSSNVSQNSKSTPSPAIVLPSDIDFVLNLACQQVIYRKFSGKNAAGRIRLASNKIYFDSVSFYSADGWMNWNGKLERKGSQYFISGIARADHIDITKLFYIFNNFEQKFITDKNVKGKVTGLIQVKTYWSTDFDIDLDKLNVIGDLTITGGELINFEPLQNLMGFVRMKKMKDVVFDKMENVLIIKDRTIKIPRMNLNSNAFSIAVSGEHTFDNNLNYNLKVNLTRLFFGKNNKKPEEYEDGENDKNGGINLYVIMFGSGEDIKYKFDKKALKSKFRESYDNQKREVKNILKKETENQGNSESEFEYKWEDE